MTALHFGKPDSPLFGVYHPASGERRQRSGTVLCNAFGAEYLLSHFALRRVAVELSRRGHDVLRFDYSGTGDSSGAQEDVSLDQWLIDIDVAIDELRDTAELDSVSLLGVRLGAGLACVAAARRPDVVQSVVAWDPVLRGDLYLTWLRDAERMLHPGDSGEPQVLGHPLPDSFRTQLERFDATDTVATLGERVMLLRDGTGEDAEKSRPFEQALTTGDIIVDPLFVEEMVSSLCSKRT